MNAEKLVLVSLVSCLLLLARPDDHISADEVTAALAAKPNTGFVRIEDAGFSAPSRCNGQMPSVSIFTPAGWINALGANARSQYRQFKPAFDDTLRALTIITRGCAGGTSSGPSCESVTRVALLSSVRGEKVAEAISNSPISSSWQNGFGATAACTSLLSKFMLADVQGVQDANGEFLVAVFDGSRRLKVYTVKQKHLKSLGMKQH